MNNQGFNIDWKQQREGNTNYFSYRTPETQMQLTFQNHYKFMKHLLGDRVQHKNCMEQGCGRGNLSMYFANEGSNMWLMDIYIKNAFKAYKNVKSVANGDVFMFIDDACNSKINDEKIDFIFSVGLLEHVNFWEVFGDNYRILKKGGVFCHYVVPEKKSIQHAYPYSWINKLLGISRKKKPEIYRDNTGPEVYVTKAKIAGFKHVNYSWCMPIPLISHSPSYPFSALPGWLEKKVVKHQQKLIKEHGWLCNEEVGQGFYIWGYKS